MDRSRVAETIFHDLRNRIVSGALARGARLPTEKDLAEAYGVSGPTVREAIRGLTITGLVEVRHGSGAYVIADADALVAMSLGAIIQLNSVGVADVLRILGVLQTFAVGQAAEMADDEDFARLREALAQLDAAADPAAGSAGVRAFHRAVAMLAHNPLLTALVGFLADIQARLALELSSGTPRLWAGMLAKLRPVRLALVEAIEARDADAARRLAADFHAQAADLITSLPKGKAARLSDPALGAMLSSMISRQA